MVSTLQSQMQKFQVCVPELQQEINGLNVNTSNQNGWLTSAYLNNPTIVSQQLQQDAERPVGLLSNRNSRRRLAGTAAPWTSQ